MHLYRHADIDLGGEVTTAEFYCVFQAFLKGPFHIAGYSSVSEAPHFSGLEACQFNKVLNQQCSCTLTGKKQLPAAVLPMVGGAILDDALHTKLSTPSSPQQALHLCKIMPCAWQPAGLQVCFYVSHSAPDLTWGLCLVGRNVITVCLCHWMRSAPLTPKEVGFRGNDNERGPLGQQYQSRIYIQLSEYTFVSYQWQLSPVGVEIQSKFCL